MKCVECFKARRLDVRAEYVYMGKSWCEACLPAGLEAGREIERGIDDLRAKA